MSDVTLSAHQPLEDTVSLSVSLMETQEASTVTTSIFVILESCGIATCVAAQAVCFCEVSVHIVDCVYCTVNRP